jgi:hypothetical protein
MFYDCHAHEIKNQDGGFIIALENQSKGFGLTNREVVSLDMKDSFIPVQYVTNSWNETETAIVKYHPRLEKYDVRQVEQDVAERKPKGIIIDTLNDPYWKANDYWELASRYADIPILLSHAGGYKALEFVEICNFNKNVWLDFSLSHSYFGLVNNEAELHAVTDVMRYAFESRIKDKIMFGSDTPFENQQDAIAWYEQNVNTSIYDGTNWRRFVDKIFA